MSDKQETEVTVEEVKSIAAQNKLMLFRYNVTSNALGESKTSYAYAVLFGDRVLGGEFDISSNQIREELDLVKEICIFLREHKDEQIFVEAVFENIEGQRKWLPLASDDDTGNLNVYALTPEHLSGLRSLYKYSS